MPLTVEDTPVDNDVTPVDREVVLLTVLDTPVDSEVT